MTSYAVSRGHPAPLVGKRCLAGGLRVYFCLDSCLVYINFAHTQDHDYVLYLCGGIPGLLFLVTQYKLVFSYQRSRPVYQQL